MKKILFTYDKICVCSKILHQVYDLKPTTVASEKEKRCVAYALADRFMNKYKNVIKSGQQWDNKRQYRMTLNFNEATVLHDVIVDLIGGVTDTYCYTILDSIKNELNQHISQ